MKKKITIPTNYDFCEFRGQRVCGVLSKVIFEDVYSFVSWRKMFVNIANTRRKVVECVEWNDDIVIKGGGEP